MVLIHERYNGEPLPTMQNIILLAAIGFLIAVSALAYWVG